MGPLVRGEIISRFKLHIEYEVYPTYLREHFTPTLLLPSAIARVLRI
jgi:hypothetical protein